MVVYKSNSELIQSFLKLKSYCESEDFKGWDPYDGLNSKIFQATPLKKWDLARLAWIQGFKRSPINFRKLLFVPKEHNAMGIGLFLNGYCNLLELAKKGIKDFGTVEEIETQVHHLAELLIELKTPGYSGACWGYNFDWQARRLFLFPAFTPTVVATTFCASALIYTYEVTGKNTYLQEGVSACEFVKNDLNRTPYQNGHIFSYSPLNGNNTVFNASLLGAKLLSLGYHYTNNKDYKDLAESAVKAAVSAQAEDGSWIYGMLPVQSWIDSFHTGFNLDALEFYKQYAGDQSVQKSIDKGFKFYLNNFFLEDGTPKYYHNKTYPIDIHCPGQLLVTLSTLGKTDQHQSLAKKVLGWTIEHMQDKEGYFYYQVKKRISSKISYMRWSNAFMFNAMSHYFRNIL
ncbi:MAG: delta-aminolevulinic acid dehydratase [Cytophagia bacterium]|nr:delta-aminolevulinic acid dehydratase [Cytophagia bacterium]